MDDFAQAAFREREAREILRKRAFYVHLSIYLAVQVMLIGIWAMTTAGYPWFIFPMLGWGVGIAAHGASAFLLSHPDDIVLEREAKRRAAG